MKMQHASVLNDLEHLSNLEAEEYCNNHIWPYISKCAFNGEKKCELKLGVNLPLPQFNIQHSSSSYADISSRANSIVRAIEYKGYNVFGHLETDKKGHSYIVLKVSWERY